jgi:NodT family efflux transporter outer membrane factor (OMF) lipoprotein
VRRTAVVLALLAGCAVGPDYERPPATAPAGWGEKADTSTADLSRWWTLFGDAALDGLIERALAANPDLRVATARVREARALVGVAQGGLLPEVDAGGSYARNRTSENVATFPGIDRYESFYRAGFDAAWEIDLFGGARRAIEAARADYEGAVETHRAVQVSLLAEVARNYVALRGSRRLLAVLRGNVESASSTVDLVRARLQAGVATAFDVARAEAQLASARAQLPSVEAAAKQSIHRLGVLLGRDPQGVAAELAGEAPIPVPPARVVVGLPSDLLRRRPDVRAAERQLAAATARVGEATAELYPKISLTAAFGLESLHAGDFFEAAGRAWSLGPAVRWPLFAGGRLRAAVAAADARAGQALALYEKSVLAALEEVENALVAYLREWDRHQALEEAVAADRRATGLAVDVYRRGLASFLDVLEAERTLFAAEAELARSDAAVSLDLVALYKSLGGGWNVAPPTE